MHYQYRRFTFAVLRITPPANAGIILAGLSLNNDQWVGELYHQFTNQGRNLIPRMNPHLSIGMPVEHVDSPFFRSELSNIRIC